MALASGTLFSSYLIAAPIGAGGMGEVYRATDTRLKRDVALKVLPPDFANDAERLARFQREAELLAALNHNNIAHIHGIETSGGITALIMELIEGPTLAERIEQGPLPPDEALNIALQLCAALEAAHERGIVHRDLKPANIKLKPDGTVKVLDFGIAKAVEATGNSGRHTPTLVTPAVTESGLIMGTAAYMSPEQARGKPVDRRTDIWAFGCVLYEMLTGQAAFGAEDIPLTLARVLSQPTDLRALPGGMAPALQQTIELCLEKDPKKRLADISDVRLVLRGRFDAAAAADQGNLKPRVRPLWLAGTVVAVVFAAFAGWWLKPAAPRDLRVNRFVHALPAAELLRNRGRSVLAVSPDGQRFAYNTTAGLLVRELGNVEARVLAGSEESLATPVFSPDGQALVYFSNVASQLKRIALTGGAPIVLTERLQGSPLDISWARDGYIYYNGDAGIWRVPEAGGVSELMVAAEERTTFANPELLPDGDTLLYIAISNSVSEYDTATILARSLSTGDTVELVRGGTDPQFVAPGYLLYGLDSGLYGVAFDPATRRVTGSPVALAQGLMTTTATLNYRVSDNGTLMYMTGESNEDSTLVWIDRTGKEEPLAITPERYAYPRISPDGTRVSLGFSAAGSNLWVWNFAAETLTQLTIGTALGNYGIWSPDGARLAFSGAVNTLETKASNNTGQVSPAADIKSDGQQAPTPSFYTPDGRNLVYRNQDMPGTNDDLAMVAVGGNESVILLNDTWSERNAELSPDGRWMAYDSNESGQFEVYVRPFPNINDDRVQVSNAGGGKAVWSRDGRELFYLQTDAAGRGQLMAVTVDTAAPNFSYGARTKVLDWPYMFATEGRTYDVAPDGQRFLAVKPFRDDSKPENPPQVVIVQNFTEDLQRLVPTE